MGQIQMNFFEQGESAMDPEVTICGENVHYCSEEDRKVAWMSEKRNIFFIQTEPDNCRNELG